MLLYTISPSNSIKFPCYHIFFFFNDTATPEIYTLSLHDALPIWTSRPLPRSQYTSLSPTKPGAVRRRPRELVRPRPRPDERHERARRSFSNLEAAVGHPGCNDQDLPAPRADRGDDSSARRELVPPRLRDLRGACGRQDAVVRSPLGIA